MKTAGENNRSFGSIGEDIAVKYLENNGYKIIERNFRVGRMGEIDIIAQESEYICFIEVKTRRSLKYGAPSEAVTRKKQIVILKLASLYIRKNRLQNRFIRFDVVEIIASGKIDKEIHADYINIIRNAFY